MVEPATVAALVAKEAARRAAVAAWKRRGGVAAAIGAVLVAAPMAFMAPVAVMGGADTQNVSACTPLGNGGVGLGVPQGEAITAANLTQDQSDNARVVVTVGQRAGVPVQGLVVAIATTLQESGLRNINYGDRDSLGLFQQRPSTGWGTPAQVTDPVLASEAFYGVAAHTNNPGLMDVKGWQSMSVTQAAQAVQRSGFPTAYAKWEDEARIIVASVGGSSATVNPATGTQVPGTGNALTAACNPSGGSQSGVEVGAGGWVAPLPSPFVITSGFGPRRSPTAGASSVHAGIDFGVPIGTPVYAAADGTVVRAGAASGYGIAVYLQHADGVITRYGHLSRTTVSVGDTVTAGQQIALSGNTGVSTGAHLHFEVRPGDVPTNPVPWMASKGVTL